MRSFASSVVGSRGDNSRPQRSSIPNRSKVPTRSTRGYDAGKKTNGRKHHIAVTTNGLLLAVVVTTASIQDRDGAFRIIATLDEKFSTITHIWADAGYSGRFVDWAKRHSWY